jgi:glutaredoxin 3
MFILYTKTGCPWCDEVREFLLEKSIVFEERNVTEDPALMEEMVSKSNQTKAPTIDLNGEIFADLGREEAEKIFKDKELI